MPAENEVLKPIRPAPEITAEGAMASTHAPFIFFDAAAQLHLQDGVARISLEAQRQYLKPPTFEPAIDVVTVCQLRGSLRAFQHLKQAIERIELLAAPASNQN